MANMHAWHDLRMGQKETKEAQRALLEGKLNELDNPPKAAPNKPKKPVNLQSENILTLAPQKSACKDAEDHVKANQ